MSNFTKQIDHHYRLIREQPHWPGERLLESGVAGEDKHRDLSADKYHDHETNRGRVAIFIDGANLFHAALQLGIEIDYAKLLCHLTNGSRLLRAFFYTGVDRTNEKQQGFLLWMRRNGYRVVTKDLVQLPDGSKKANLDVEIAVDMMNLAPYYDTGVLVSGDGDLAYAVNAVTYKGVRVEVVSVRSMTSDSLIDVADCFIEIDTIKQHIQKDSHSSYKGAIAVQY
ncbi:NYN domain-containing protein [Iningainema tapete]|uniref:NYN domain-containing protein n=1 Tax=Iningainema tapete BLCC-T55 TaxID=2748662 RepID=A0A8J6XML0_9CYAN|nr:NYN domain-containing protein [Iningainema tapete]MBD2775977.1 NYN domain-containing protein [Iningainema tapete BLCC-T55]